MKSRRSRRDFEDMKHSRIEISEDSQITAEVIEAAHILIQLYHDRKGLFLQWGAKRSRYEQNPFHTSATPASRLNSKKVIAKKRPRERAPKKLTKPELKEMVDKLSLEHSILIKEAEQMRKKYQGLKDCNFNLNSQLALCSDQRQEQNMPYTYRPSSSQSDTRQKTETTTSCDNADTTEENAESRHN
jgi:hypothetical protein